MKKFLNGVPFMMVNCIRVYMYPHLSTVNKIVNRTLQIMRKEMRQGNLYYIVH